MDSNKQGFPQVLRNWGRGIFKISFFGGARGRGLESIRGGREHGELPRKGKYFINICTVAYRLKKPFFY